MKNTHLNQNSKEFKNIKLKIKEEIGKASNRNTIEELACGTDSSDSGNTCNMKRLDIPCQDSGLQWAKCLTKLSSTYCTLRNSRLSNILIRFSSETLG